MNGKGVWLESHSLAEGRERRSSSGSEKSSPRLSILPSIIIYKKAGGSFSELKASEKKKKFSN
jgi:hypothetical protein